MHTKPTTFDSKGKPGQRRIEDLREIFITNYNTTKKHSEFNFDEMNPETLIGFRDPEESLKTKFKLNGGWWLIMGMERNNKGCQCVNLDTLKHYVIDNLTIIQCFEHKDAETESVPSMYELSTDTDK